MLRAQIPFGFRLSLWLALAAMTPGCGTQHSKQSTSAPASALSTDLEEPASGPLTAKPARARSADWPGATAGGAAPLRQSEAGLDRWPTDAAAPLSQPKFRFE